jgi:hypothetical protein
MWRLKKQRKTDWAESNKPYLSDQYISLAIRDFHQLFAPGIITTDTSEGCCGSHQVAAL